MILSSGVERFVLFTAQRHQHVTNRANFGSQGDLIEFSGHPQADDPRFEAPNTHITTSVAGGSLFLMKPVKMRPIAPLIFLPELFPSSVFADEPFPLSRRIS